MATFQLEPDSKKIKRLDDDMLDKIVEMTGATGIFIMITDTPFPCPDAKAGLKCEGGHTMFVAMKDINPLAIPQIIADQTGVTDFNIQPMDGHDDPDIPHGS